MASKPQNRLTHKTPDTDPSTPDTPPYQRQGHTTVASHHPNHQDSTSTHQSYAASIPRTCRLANRDPHSAAKTNHSMVLGERSQDSLTEPAPAHPATTEQHNSIHERDRPKAPPKPPSACKRPRTPFPNHDRNVEKNVEHEKSTHHRRRHPDMDTFPRHCCTVGGPTNSLQPSPHSKTEQRAQ